MPSGEWTDGAFPVLDPRGFYSTSGACSVSPFTTMVRSSFRRRRQEVYVGGFSCAAQLNGMNPEHLFSSGVVSVADRAPRTDQQPAPPSGPSPVGSHPVSRGGRAPFD